MAELIVFTHEENHQGRPTGEGLAALALARPVVVLFPNVTGPSVFLHHIAHQVGAQLVVNPFGLKADALFSQLGALPIHGK